jgi:hypothetical protein
MSLISEIKTGLNKLDHSTSALKKFAITMAIALGVLATLVFFLGSHPERAYWLAGIGLLFLLFGLIFPQALKPVHVLWMTIALFLGFFMSRILLTVLFFLVITPIGLLMRLFGKDLLDKNLQTDRKSYWLKREKKANAPEQYEKLF